MFQCSTLQDDAVIYRWLFIGARNLSSPERGVISKPVILQVLYFLAFVTLLVWNLCVQKTIYLIVYAHIKFDCFNVTSVLGTDSVKFRRLTPNI